MPTGAKVTFCRIAFGVLLALALVVISPTQGKAQIPDLIVTVGDTVGSSGEQNSVVTVFLDNFFDTVSAFELWIKIGNTELLEFQTDTITVVDTTWWICVGEDPPGTCTAWVASDAEVTWWVCDSLDGQVCVDSSQVAPEDSLSADFSHVADSMNVTVQDVTVGSVDTTGSLIAGWEFVRSGPVFDNGSGNEIKVTAVADRLTVPGSRPGIAPQQGGVLFRLLGDVKNVPDTTTERTTAILPDPFLDHFNFSTPAGLSLGLGDSTVVDSNFFHCNSWVVDPDSTCLQWEKVSSSEPWDSVSVELDTVVFVDTSKVKLYSGSLTVLSGICGQIDGDPDDNVDVGDLTYLINFLFLGGPAPESEANANVDCSAPQPGGTIDVGDLTYMIAFLFLGGAEPCAGC